MRICPLRPKIGAHEWPIGTYISVLLFARLEWDGLTKASTANTHIVLLRVLNNPLNPASTGWDAGICRGEVHHKPPVLEPCVFIHLLLCKGMAGYSYAVATYKNKFLLVVAEEFGKLLDELMKHAVSLLKGAHAHTFNMHRPS